MRLRYLWLISCFLAFEVAAAGAITPGASQTCYQGTTSIHTCSNSTALTVSAGDMIVLAARVLGITSITDTCNFTWTSQPAGPQILQLWIGTGGTAGNCTITSTRSTNGPTEWIAQVYSGVASVGQIVAVALCTGSSPAGGTNNCPVSITTSAGGNWVVGFFGINTSDTATTITASAGVMRTPVFKPAGTSLSTLIDNTSSTAASVTVTGTWGSPNIVSYMSRTAIELVMAVTPVSTLGYFASPPLVAGTGITLTPSPTGIVISTTAALNARRGLAGMVLIRNLRIAPGSCSDKIAREARGVSSGDVIGYSSPERLFTVWSFADFNHVNFRICNPTGEFRSASFRLRWEVRH